MTTETMHDAEVRASITAQIKGKYPQNSQDWRDGYVDGWAAAVRAILSPVAGEWEVIEEDVAAKLYRNDRQQHPWAEADTGTRQKWMALASAAMSAIGYQRIDHGVR